MVEVRCYSVLELFVVVCEKTSRVTTRTCPLKSSEQAVDCSARQTLMASPSARIAGMSFFFGLIPHDLFDPVPSAHRCWIDVVTI